MGPYDIEVILIGLVLRYGMAVARIVLPELTPDKFIFGTSGNFGVDHSLIWETISEVSLADKAPTYAVVATELEAEYHPYLTSIIDRLEKKYFIYELDFHQVEDLKSLVEKNGLLYSFASHAKQNGTILSDLEHFSQTASTIKDVERWVNDRISEYHVVQSSTEGYKHISVAVEKTLESWGRQFKGEQLVLLPCGIPTLMAYHLFPLRKMAVVHGLSGSGKSAFVHQVNLGTAIGLVANNIKGCVAVNSLEMEQEDLVERMVSGLAHIDVSRFIDGKITKDEFLALTDWAEFVAHLPIFIDDTNFITTSAMQYRATGLHTSEYGPVLQLSSDYGELFHDQEGETEEQRVNRVFREQFLLSRMIGTSVIAISQSTVDKQTSNRTYIAGPDGTRYSRGVLQAADILVEVWNPVPKIRLYVVVQN